MKTIYEYYPSTCKTRCFIYAPSGAFVLRPMGRFFIGGEFG